MADLPKSRLLALPLEQLRRIARALGVEPSLRKIALIEALRQISAETARSQLSEEDWAACCPQHNPLYKAKSPDACGADGPGLYIRLSPAELGILRATCKEGETVTYLARTAVKAYCAALSGSG